MVLSKVEKAKVNNSTKNQSKSKQCLPKTKVNRVKVNICIMKVSEVKVGIFYNHLTTQFFGLEMHIFNNFSSDMIHFCIMSLKD